MIRRSHPRNWQERSGQVNVRNDAASITRDTLGKVSRGETVTYIPGKRREPDCTIVVTKRKGFGTTGNKESSPLPERSVNIMLNQFTSDLFHRYKVNVYIKPVFTEDGKEVIDEDGRYWNP